MPVCKDSYGLPMTLKAFKKTNAHCEGCAMCGGSIEPFDDFLWYGNLEGDALCETCTEGMK